jgi:hypothetical protein
MRQPEPDSRAQPPVGRDVRSLGGVSETELAVRRIAPWMLSVLLHVFLVIMAFFITWGVTQLQQEKDPPLIVADFNALTYAPLHSLEVPPAEFDDPQTNEPVMETLDEIVNDSLLEVEVDPINLIATEATASPLAQFAPAPMKDAATFAGITSTNARRIVYVIDASGSMVASFPIVVDELERSLRGLTEEQSFAVVFFQSDTYVMVPPEDRLITATTAEKRRVRQWIDEHVIARYRSNPVAAIEKALELKPDVVFVLSTNITGMGEFEIDQRDLMALLDKINPRVGDSQRRRTTINCIQFLDEDPLNTLEIIAAEHGGPRGYRFLTREELGLAPR